MCIEGSMSRTLLPGKPYPLGATAYKRGTNFALFSEGATRVDVCLFDSDGKQTDCVTLRERTAFVWHGFINGIKPGQLYGYRVDGPWDPEHGLRFNFNKLARRSLCQGDLRRCGLEAARSFPTMSRRAIR